ncbi:hypothetical protein HK098_003537 [Nowakowskiella sp. JEL0407]|nr:hypothetical protein HK098_003537 [Nowakowskiella sp. JEL0407]
MLSQRLLRNVPLRQISGIRQFSHSAVSYGLFKDYLATIRPTIKEITPQQLDKKLTQTPGQGPPANLHLLDVRETYEWNEEHIPYAVYTGRGALERDIEGIVSDPNDEVVLYCAGGNRSILAAEALQKMGYKNVFSLDGGIGRWKKEGYPLNQNYNTYSEMVKY